MGCKAGEYAWIGKISPERCWKVLDSKNRGAGGVEFLIKDYLCEIVEVINDTKFDEKTLKRVPGERGAKYYS